MFELRLNLMFAISTRQFLSALQRSVVLTAVGLLFSGTSALADEMPATSSRAIYGDKDSDKRLVIGSVTNAPRYNFGQMQPLSMYILDRVKDLGIEAVMVVTTDTHEQMIQLMREGHVDWISATPYAALMYEREAEAEFILTKKSRGRGDYRTVFFTRSDSGIKSLDDLRGKTIAFEKPGSTSAYFLPAMELLGAGLTLVKLDSPRESAPADSVGYVFSGDEVNSSTWVHKRISDAAAFSDEDWESEWRTPIGFRDDLKIFHQTAKVPRSLEVVRPGLDPLLRTKIVHSLLELNDHREGGEIARGYYHASDFAMLTSDQNVELDRIRKVINAFDVTMDQTGEQLASSPGK